MLFLEHLEFVVKSGLPAVEFKDKMGRKLSIIEAINKGLNRIASYIQDFDLLILRIVGYLPLYSIRWLFYTLAGVKIGRGVHIHIGTQFFNPRGVTIGEGSIIGQNAFLDGRDKLNIGKYVDIASEVMIYNSEHDINSDDFKAITASVDIGDYCFIGPRVIILPGIKIGRGVVIAAGAVVTKDIPNFAIAGGVPAKVIGERQHKNPNYKLGRARLFQ